MLKINYDEIISTAEDYRSIAQQFYRKYPGPNYITHEDPDLYDAYRAMDRAERALSVVCYVVGVAPSIAISAARIADRYYDLAYSQGRDPGIIDAQHLLETLVSNAE